jgi:hypothetical protein
MFSFSIYNAKKKHNIFCDSGMDRVNYHSFILVVLKKILVAQTIPCHGPDIFFYLIPHLIESHDIMKFVLCMRPLVAERRKDLISFQKNTWPNMEGIWRTVI